MQEEIFFLCEDMAKEPTKASSLSNRPSGHPRPSYQYLSIQVGTPLDKPNLGKNTFTKLIKLQLRIQSEPMGRKYSAGDPAPLWMSKTFRKKKEEYHPLNLFMDIDDDAEWHPKGSHLSLRKSVFDRLQRR